MQLQLHQHYAHTGMGMKGYHSNTTAAADRSARAAQHRSANQQHRAHKQAWYVPHCNSHDMQVHHNSSSTPPVDRLRASSTLLLQQRCCAHSCHAAINSSLSAALSMHHQPQAISMQHGMSSNKRGVD